MGARVESTLKGFFEYITEMSESDKRRLRSLVEMLLSHHLKIKYVGGRDISHWKIEAREFEDTLFELIVNYSPGLKSYEIDLQQVHTKLVRLRPFPGKLRKAYLRADFPEVCPFTLENVVGQRVWNELKN